MKMSQMRNDPGIDSTVHLFQMLTTSAALPSTTSKIAVYVQTPHSQCPPILPSDMIRSFLKKYVEKMYAKIE